MTVKLSSVGSLISPTGGKPSGKNKQHEKQAGEPKGFLRDKLNLEQIQRERKQHGQEHGEPKSDRGSAKHQPNLSYGKQIRKTSIRGKIDLQEGQIENNPKKQQRAKKTEQGY